jgi:hypothetical protein
MFRGKHLEGSRLGCESLTLPYVINYIWFDITAVIQLLYRLADGLEKKI